MRIPYRWAIVLCLVCLVQAPALAQPSSGANLIMNKRVQEELNLTADQARSLEVGLRKVQEKYREQFANVPVVRPGTDPRPGAAPMPDPKTVAELVHKRDAENKKVLAEVLKPEQASRLKQIELQLEGLRALTNKEVALALKLTDDQKSQVKKLFDGIATATSMAAPPGLTGPEGLDAANKAFGEAWNKAFKAATEKIPSLLTPEQRRRWEGMTGAPFQLEPVVAPKGGPADAPQVGFIKIEARGNLVRNGPDYFLVVNQNKVLVRSNADKSAVNKTLLAHKDSAVVLKGNLSWLPKGAQVNSDDDYALGIVVQEEAQLRRLDQKDPAPHYIKVEARGEWMIQDNSLVVLVQLQETPAKRVFVSGPWRIWGLDRLSAVLLKTKQAAIAGHATWESPVGTYRVVFRLQAPQLVDPPLDWNIPRDQGK
jgi:hypothetical protein